MRRTWTLGCFVLAAAVTASYADIAVKFHGEIVPNIISSENEAVVEAFFDGDPRFRDDFACFEGGLFDLKTGNKAGVGVDCLAIVGIDETLTAVTDLGNVSNTLDLSAAIDAVTFFFFPGGHLINDGWTSVRPFLVSDTIGGIGNGDGTPGEGSVSHLTGSIPGQTSGVVAASGKFSEAVGRATVRLSGAVDLTLPGGTFFSCLFVIENALGTSERE